MEPAARATLASMSNEAPYLLADIEAVYKTRFRTASAAHGAPVPANKPEPNLLRVAP